jgi:hypothetical protein
MKNPIQKILARKLSLAQRNLLDLHGLTYEVRLSRGPGFYVVAWLGDRRYPVSMRLCTSIEHWIDEIQRAKVYMDTPLEIDPFVSGRWTKELMEHYTGALKLSDLVDKATQ